MRKKKLLEQNADFFLKLEEAKKEISELKAGLSNAESENAALKDEIEALKKQVKNDAEPAAYTETPLERLSKKVTENAKLSLDTDYGSKAIGNIVKVAAMYATRLGTAPQNLELVNLILGRGEIAKADILQVISSDDSSEIKNKKIDNIKDSTLDYFESVMAQEI